MLWRREKSCSCHKAQIIATMTELSQLLTSQKINIINNTEEQRRGSVELCIYTI
jgi:hypothetical protein